MKVICNKASKNRCEIDDCPHAGRHTKTEDCEEGCPYDSEARCVPVMYIAS